MVKMEDILYSLSDHVSTYVLRNSCKSHTGRLVKTRRSCTSNILDIKSLVRNPGYQRSTTL